jgi:hypothetical protein
VLLCVQLPMQRKSRKRNEKKGLFSFNSAVGRPPKKTRKLRTQTPGKINPRCWEHPNAGQKKKASRYYTSRAGTSFAPSGGAGGRRAALVRYFD